MDRVRTKTLKKSSHQVIDRYYSRMTLDFHTNKKVLEEVAIIPSRWLRNMINGFTTHLMRRIQRSPVRGIYLKLQEEERKRRKDFVPDESALKELDADLAPLPVDSSFLALSSMPPPPPQSFVLPLITASTSRASPSQERVHPNRILDKNKNRFKDLFCGSDLFRISGANFGFRIIFPTGLHSTAGLRSKAHSRISFLLYPTEPSSS